MTYSKLYPVKNIALIKKLTIFGNSTLFVSELLSEFQFRWLNIQGIDVAFYTGRCYSQRIQRI